VTTLSSHDHSSRKKEHRKNFSLSYSVIARQHCPQVHASARAPALARAVASPFVTFDGNPGIFMAANGQ
jgi:hypothetical protein